MAIKSATLKILTLATILTTTNGAPNDQQTLADDADNAISPYENAGSKFIRSPSKLQARADALNFFAGQRQFSLEMFQAISRQSVAKNIFFSPYSAHQLLLLAYFFARGPSKNTLHDALRIPMEQRQPQANLAYRVTEKLSRVPHSYEFNSVSRIYVPRSARVKPCLAKMYSKEIQLEDMETDPEGVRLRINQFVGNATKGNIPELLAPGTITTKTNIALVNAAHFKAKWRTAFPRALTQDGDFHVRSGEIVQTPMMTVEGSFYIKFHAQLQARSIELPYEPQTINDDVSMFIILPNPNTTTNELLLNLNAKTIDEIVRLEPYTLHDVTVSLPRFSIETTVNLKPVLTDLGFDELLSGRTDLQYLVGNASYELNEALQKSKLEVDESGSEASSATAILTNRFGGSVSLFYCNRPFVYFIYKKVTETILFAGVYEHPDSYVKA